MFHIYAKDIIKSTSLKNVKTIGIIIIIITTSLSIESGGKAKISHTLGEMEE